MRPLIGIPCDDGDTPVRPGRPATARYELKRSYADAVYRAGGLPVLLPYALDAADELLARLEGLLLAGGAFDIPPEEYGETPQPGCGPVKPERTRFERRVLEGALARGLPVLGVCGGMQLLNVAHGGTLVQDLPTQHDGALAHQQPDDPRKPSHAVRVETGSLLHRICETEALQVNSTHHQAVAKLGAGLDVIARAPDGVVEAIQSHQLRFVLGVQWHPESLSDDPSRRIYRALVDAARG